MYLTCNASPDIVLKIHDKAIAAYKWMAEYPPLINWVNLPSPISSALLAQPLRGVLDPVAGSKKAKIFYLYAPLWPAKYWSQSQIPSNTLLIYPKDESDLSDTRIESDAWASVLQMLFLSVDVQAIAPLRDGLQQLLPEWLSHELFGKKKLTDADVCRWTGLNRSTLTQQRRTLAANLGQCAPLDSDDLKTTIEQLGKPWNPQKK